MWVVSDLQITQNGILMVSQCGRATGEAFVQFASEEHTERALEKNKQSMGHRWVRSYPGGWDLVLLTSDYLPFLLLFILKETKWEILRSTKRKLNVNPALLRIHWTLTHFYKMVIVLPLEDTKLSLNLNLAGLKDQIRKDQKCSLRSFWGHCLRRNIIPGINILFI